MVKECLMDRVFLGVTSLFGRRGKRHTPAVFLCFYGVAGVDLPPVWESAKRGKKFPTMAGRLMIEEGHLLKAKGVD